MLTGTYQTEVEAAGRLLDALPALVVLRADTVGLPPRPAARHEIVKEEPGQQVVLDRLLDLLLMTPSGPGSRARTHPPAVVQANTIPSSGGRCGCCTTPRPTVDGGHPGRRRRRLPGRTGRRFNELVGEPPMTFLTSWRMALAADLLSSRAPPSASSPPGRLRSPFTLQHRVQAGARGESTRTPAADGDRAPGGGGRPRWLRILSARWADATTFTGTPSAGHPERRGRAATGARGAGPARCGFVDLAPDLLTLQETIVTDTYDQVRDVLGDGYHLVHQTAREDDGQGITTAQPVAGRAGGRGRPAAQRPYGRFRVHQPGDRDPRPGAVRPDLAGQPLPELAARPRTRTLPAGRANRQDDRKPGRRTSRGTVSSRVTWTPIRTPPACGSGPAGIRWTG